MAGDEIHWLSSTNIKCEEPYPIVQIFRLLKFLWLYYMVFYCTLHLL